MKRKKLNKELLSELLLGNTERQMNTELLESEEVKALMYHQWKNPQEVRVKRKPDLDSIYARIREKTHPEKTSRSANTEFLIGEIDQLKSDNRSLRRNVSIIVAVAATLLILVSLVSLTIMTRNQVFSKTYTESIAPKGQKSHLILPDGTHVYLNSGSVLRYDNHFGRRYRDLELVGEGYFEVTKNERLPFVISAGDVKVEVIGTKFNVMAYPDDNTIETIVTEGKVAVSEVGGEATVLITANQKATFHKDTRLLLMNDINPEISLSWKEDMLVFDNANFTDVIKKLERWYDVAIHVEGTDSIADRYTMTIKSESLREVLELISLTTEIDFEIEANDVTITYK